jgi:[ribosomal protein S5]-alanine N-acetyltransferase
MLKLQSKNLLLRPYTAADSALLISLYKDWKWEGVDDAFAHNFFIEVIQKQYDLGGGVLATFIKQDNTYIGHCGLKYIETQGEWFLSFRFLKAFWQHDLPVEAIKVCFEWGFNRLNLNEIVVDLEEKNGGAAKILQKAGMKYRYNFEQNGIPLIRYSIFS